MCVVTITSFYVLILRYPTAKGIAMFIMPGLCFEAKQLIQKVAVPSSGSWFSF